MNINKPQNFEDLLKLQKVLDEEVGKPRENGFIPRKRNYIDIFFSIDDEIQEWLKELPKQFNFKTWKQKEYNRENELEEIVDILFFILQACNMSNRPDIVLLSSIEFSKFEKISHSEIYNESFIEKIMKLKRQVFWYDDLNKIVKSWIIICRYREFSKQEILNTYYKKWQKNMTRINKDWSLNHEKN